MQRLVEPAIELARNGVKINTFQAYILDIVKAIYRAYPETHALYSSNVNVDELVKEGEILRMSEFADALDCMAREGESLFYKGEVAQVASRLCADKGGHLTRADFEQYRVIKRKPLAVDYRQSTLLTNPAPSSGGVLIAFALKLLEPIALKDFDFGSAAYLTLLAQVQALTDKARIDSCLDNVRMHPQDQLLAPEMVAEYRAKIKGQPACSRGTTHISVIDRHGNIAGLTTSNGEGCGLLIPGTGIMLNNMLGEQDLNPHGFQQWPTNQRMTSMMAPSILFTSDHRPIVLGSGGSNRLRTAILQVLLNKVDFDMSLEHAISSPRIHCQADHLSIEGGFSSEQIQQLLIDYPDHKLWTDRNLFFGGVHAASVSANGFIGMGDPRRGGVAIVV